MYVCMCLRVFIYIFLISPIRAACPVQLIRLDLITIRTFSEAYRLRSSALRSLTQPPANSSLLGPNTGRRIYKCTDYGDFSLVQCLLHCLFNGHVLTDQLIHIASNVEAYFMISNDFCGAAV
jgi:hypothetical protein